MLRERWKMRKVVIIGVVAANHMLSTIYLIFWCTFLLCSSLQFSAATDAITAGRLIRDGENITSAGKRFQLGFFSPDGEYNNSRYVGIWYYLKDPITIVWVANRDNPLPADSTTGYFGIAEDDGNLKVLDGNNNTYFSTNLTSSPSSSGRRTVKLLDSGNLVLSNDLSSGSSTVLWQSFHYPTDTFLPGMKMDDKLKLTSWRSREDPFTFEQDQEAGEKQYYLIRKRTITYWKSGESGDFINYTDIPTPVTLLLSNFSELGIENTRLLMNSSGEIQYFSWDDVENNNGWSLIWSAPRDNCSVDNFCGNFGSCNSKNRLAVCKCLPGFKPSSPDNWNYGDFSGDDESKEPGHPV